MKRNWRFPLAMFLIVCLAQSSLLRAQDNSTKPSEDEEVYQIGQGISAPRPTYQPGPEYDDQSRKKKIKGTVELSMIVTKDGSTRDIKITQSLSPGLDRQAIKAVSQWRFDPATKDGAPVAVKMSVIVSFNL